MLNNQADTRRNATDSWITPKWLLQAIGPFDMDPCSCIPQPWPTASKMLTIQDDGLSQPWHGFVFCNPPYGRSLGKWLEKCASHNNAIALTFARTDTTTFHQHVFPKASAILFLAGLIKFCTPEGKTVKDNSGAPSVLIAYGRTAKDRFLSCKHLGSIWIPRP